MPTKFFQKLSTRLKKFSVVLISFSLLIESTLLPVVALFPRVALAAIATPQNLVPNGAAFSSTTREVTLSWGSVVGAVKYAVRANDNTNTALRDPRNSCPGNPHYLCVDGLTSTSITLPVQAGANYTWWVHAISSSGEWSSAASAAFSVQNVAPGTIVIQATKDGVSWDSPQFTVSGNTPAGPFTDNPIDPPQTLSGVPVGAYTISSVAPPAGVTLKDINGSSLPYSQTLSASGTITFTFNFVTPVQTGAITIARLPASSPSSPHKVGSATTFTGGILPSLFNTDQFIYVWRQIGSLTPFIAATSTTYQVRDSGICSIYSGICSVSGTWQASDFMCPAGTAGVQQMTEWLTIGNEASDKIQWWFECVAGTVIIKTTKDGQVWDSPHFVINNTGPLGTFNGDLDTDAIGQQTFSGLPAGTYTMNYAVELPGGVTLQNVNGAALPHSQTLSAGGTAIFTFNFITTSLAAPILDSITPASIANGATNVTIVFKGSNFQTGAQLRIFHPLGTLLGETTSTTSPAVSVVSSSELHWGPFPVIASDPGEYDIQVKNPDGRLSGLKRVTVTGTPPPPQPPSGLPAPTPTTAPMATLILNREQEQVLPDQPISFSGTLDNGVLNAAGLAFPQGSSLFVSIPEKTAIVRFELDGKALGAGEGSLTEGGAKIPFPSNLYNDSHSFRIVLQNEISAVPQLDRNIAAWVSVIGPDSKLLLKGRTASTMVAHLPTEVIGRGISRTVPIMDTAFPCCWVSADPSHFPIREFNFSEMDITRGPFFTPNQAPMLSENIAFTLFPADASMQRLGMSLKQFSEPLAKEFITADYQYLLGRDPSQEELSRYLPTFTAWRNPYANLMEVYNRRADVRQVVLVPRDKNIGGSNSGSPLPSWDKLLEWATTKGWQEEPSLASFKLQSGFDDGWRLFQQLWVVRSDALASSPFGADNYRKDDFDRIADLCATVGQLWHYYPWVIADVSPSQGPDFAKCWANPWRRHNLILWAKDKGWAYNYFLVDHYADGVYGGVSAVTINPSDPILASMFGPGKYPEYAQEPAMRYPPAQLYYDLISSSEYASAIQQRFRRNIDSVFRLFFSRPASESDIAWVKNKFLGGIASYEFSDSKVFGFDRRWSWINNQWEPNGGLIASNFQYIEDEEFLKNSRFITDDVYGIRHIQGEIDAVSSRLIEMIERTKKAELYQGDNFKRIVSGLYRLYLRRNPTDAEVEQRRASGKSFGDIEFSLNQSDEYTKGPAPADAVKSLYRNYLGRDPSADELAARNTSSLSTLANRIGKSAEMRAYAQAHPENAYIFPIKEIKMKKCGFFCSVMGKIIGIVIAVTASYFGFPQMLIGLPGGIGAAIGSAAVGSLSASFNVTRRVMDSLSKGFNESGFNGETFVQHVSIARAMAGQAGGVFSVTNIFENADPTILDGFRTMARAPQTSGSAFAQAGQPYLWLASPLGAIAGLFGIGQTAPAKRLAQIDVSSHYGSGVVAPLKSAASATKGSTAAVAKAQFTKTLKQGSRGAEVLKLQKLLGEMDLAFLPEYQTGYYGAKTVAAVKRFQKRNGLEPVGFAGAKTRALLNASRQ